MVRLTSDALEILDALAGDSTENRMGYAVAKLNGEISQIIYDAREASGISQRELAQRMGTSQSAISRQECLDYTGHTVSMLARMLAAMDLELVVAVRPIEKPKQRKASKRAPVATASKRPAVKTGPKKSAVKAPRPTGKPASTPLSAKNR